MFSDSGPEPARETKTVWGSREEAHVVLERFCIYLNYHFQGEPVDIDMPDIW